ncbi:MAG: transcription antitermination factor NusB [Pseudomonadota bacterium]
MPQRRDKPRRGRTGERAPGVPGLAARSGALKLLRAVLEGQAMLDDQHLDAAPQDRAAARTLADLALRRLGQIDDALGNFVERAPKPAARQILRLLAAELLFHGTPPHAAVDLAVRLARRDRDAQRAAGMINAVGRRLAENGAGIVAAQDAVALNTVPWLAKRLTADWGAEVTAKIAQAHLAPAPHDLTLANPADASPLAAEIGGTLLPNGSLRLKDRPQISALPGYEQGAWWVQDAAATLPVQMLGDVAGRRVLDLCAAPGGKTMQLAAAGADVTALDLSAERLGRVAQNLDRTGLEATLVEADALTWSPDQPFDAVVLDAPCSATGTIRRHPDLPHRGDGKGQTRLTDLQARLLDRAFGFTAPGGTLVYCTCSLLKSEGEDQVARFLKGTPGAALDTLTASDPVPPEFISPDGHLRTRPDLWPDLGGLDGFFAARIRRD